ncbi:CLIP domain-containing serine protease 2-like [Photinus pyralis]|uniref:CLIP domain-containing serine protease 2-like n=1 Tax=Photinus pyralis TaxID=7054 RepID=UPI0012675D51|nr:CLIP domain-containing serine protease 2-like [Photinus pyralis]
MMRNYLGLVVIWSAIVVAVKTDCLSECIPVTECAHLFDLLRKDNRSERDVQVLKEAHCGYKLKTPTVCCERKREETHTDNGLLPGPDVCGLQPSERLLGGYVTSIGQFPWLALLTVAKPVIRGFHCGGSLINKNYVLTAAHCIVNIPKSWQLVSVRLGEHQLDADPDCEEEEYCADSPIDVPVSEVIVHAEYAENEIGKPNDIALVRLGYPVTYTRYISPICLPTKQEIMNIGFNGTYMKVAGWGRSENDSQSNIKRQQKIPITPADACKKIYKKAGATLTDKQICAGAGQRPNLCLGDSGGPLMYSDERLVWYIFGIMSFGPAARCRMREIPEVYTNVPKYLLWIEQNIKP